MSKLTVQFSELRKSTPKYVQWLLLGAAFVVVLILLTLLLTGSKNKTTKQKSKPNEEPISIRLITINANNEESAVGNIDWANTTVGTNRSETISVRTNAPTRVSMTQNKEIAGFTAQTTCTNATVINYKLFCNIYLSYTPTVAMLPETVTLSVHWRGENEPEEMKSAEKITVMLGATAPEIKTPAPVIEPEPVVEPDPLDDDFDDRLPTMKTDIMLQLDESVLIIDTKWYSSVTQSKFDSHTWHSANMYQIFTYVKNKEVELVGKPHEVSGMLLYAKTDEDTYPEHVYSMSGNKVEVRVLNLDCDFEIIKSQLDGIVEKYLMN